MVGEVEGEVEVGGGWEDEVDVEGMVVVDEVVQGVE